MKAADDSPSSGCDDIVVNIAVADVGHVAGVEAPSRGCDEIVLQIAPACEVLTILELVNLAYEHERWLIPGPRLHLAEATHELIGPAVITVIATRSSAVVGSVRLQFEDDSGQPRAVPELGLLAVHPQAQGRGLGARLVRAAERIAWFAGCDAIELRCGRELGLETFYRALGYERVSETFGSMFDSYRPFTLVTLRRSLPRSA